MDQENRKRIKAEGGVGKRNRNALDLISALCSTGLGYSLYIVVKKQRVNNKMDGPLALPFRVAIDLSFDHLMIDKVHQYINLIHMIVMIALIILG